MGGILPFLSINSLQLSFLTSIMVAFPNNPPNFALSPLFLPITGISLVPIVLPFTTPIVSASAIMPEIEATSVDPGIHIMSSPVEHTAVIASSFSIFNAPFELPNPY